MAIYCMDGSGREQFNLCEENAEFSREKEQTDGSLARVYTCTVCSREWEAVYSYVGKFDMNGNRLD